ncbi:glycosyltransferase family 2 protein [Erwinia sp. ErVv1]|uniref:glycosyltransferase family 2 protein n=1 Tax=Erwinia sp. ErVv1 TaxID=1603299 RepID=UPI00082D6EDC|nr:glycosyltransferase family 2 protein [Erwinia sp. ErVv1]
MNAPALAIMMGLYNGGRFLSSQLKSFEEQTFTNWSLWASDDGSTDGTLSMLNAFSHSVSQPVNVFDGPHSGVCANFQSMLSSDAIDADYFAFSDQDDIWMPHKLERAVNWLGLQDPDFPALYCSRTRLINENDMFIGVSTNNTKPPAFANALLQNIASGNTMVFNRRARELIKSVANQPMVMHDWALYLVVSACGGNIFFDSLPSVHYRQHASNLIGNGMELSTRWKNFVNVHQGNKIHWNNIHFSLMDALGDYITPDNKRCLSCFRHIRHSSWNNRIRLMKRSGIYHQKFVGTLATWSYMLFDRL